MTVCKERIKVAVIGGGLAGLTAAHLLSKKSTVFEVHVFEKCPTLGLDAHSISIPSSTNAGKKRIDVPMRSFQDGYYKQMIELYRELGIRFRQCDFTYSFSSFNIKRSSGWTTYLLYNGRSGVKGFRLLPPSAFKTDSGSESYFPGFLAFCFTVFANILLLITYTRFIFLSMPVRRPNTDLTLQEWSKHFTPTSALARWMQLDTSWHFFIDMIVVPLFSAVCTAPRELVYEYPVHEILEYVWATLTSHHYKVESGTRDVVSRLSSNIPYIHTSCPVVSIVPGFVGSGQVSISTNTQLHTGFSHVIIATEANKGSTLLESYVAALPKGNVQHRGLVEQLVFCMRTIRYCKAIVVNHRDDQVLPPDLTLRKDLNLVSGLEPYDEAGTANTNPDVLPITYTMTTHRIFSDETQAVPAVYQTTNPIVKISTKDILSSSIMERAVLTVESKRALEQLSVTRKVRSGWWWFKDSTTTTTLGSLQGAGRLDAQSREVPGIWICGSYAYHGIPLLEGCVGSAKDIVEQGILPSEGLNTRVSGHQI